MRSGDGGPADRLHALRDEALRCKRCPLYGPATQTVFGEGPVDARLMFVGEQPGDSEDLAGRPFVGPAGQMFDRALAGCDAFVTTSPSARATLLAGLPSVPADRFHVIPHGRNFARMDSIAARPAPGEPIRILLPGNIGVPKGRDILAALLDHDRAGRMEFHVLGKVSDAAELAGHSRLFLHGEYSRDEFAARAAAIRPHLGAIFSIWDETWCHTLTELWSAGLPALVFDFPNVAARVRASGAGWVVPHQANLRIIEPLAAKIGAVNAVVATDVTESGNTSAASIPLALSKLQEKSPLPSGAPVLLFAFGGGLAYAGQIVRMP